MADLHFMTQWQQYCLPMTSCEQVDYSREWQPDQPSFYQYHVELAEVKDTFIDVSKFGKGIVFVNQTNLVVSGMLVRRFPYIFPKDY